MTQPIHLTLREKLLELISSSSGNTRLPSERKLGEQYNISRGTVAKVLVNLEQEGYITRIVGRGSFVVPRDKAIILPRHEARHSGTILLIYPDFYAWLIWEFSHRMEMETLRRNYNLVHIKLQQQTDFDRLAELVKAQRDLCGGVIMPPLAPDLPSRFLNELNSLEVPFVAFGNLPNLSSYPNWFGITFDERQGGYLKMRSLLRHGHRRIGFVPTEAILSREQRGSEVDGMKLACREFKLGWRQIQWAIDYAASWEEPMQAGYRGAKELLEREPDLTALYFESLRGCIGGLRAIHECGKRCPEDISVIASNSEYKLEEMLTPSISLSTGNMARVAHTALDIISSPKTQKSQLFIEPFQLTERDSVRDLSQIEHFENATYHTK